MEKIQKLSYELHDLLLSSKEFLTLKEAEINMMSDMNAKLLIDNYHSLLEKYNFDKSDSILQLLANAKMQMDKNAFVIEYKKAYKDYQILVGIITEHVFDGLKKESLLDKIIRAK